MIYVNYIISGDYVLTMNDAWEIITDGAVAIKDNKIVAVGKTKEILSKYQASKVLQKKRARYYAWSH